MHECCRCSVIVRYSQGKVYSVEFENASLMIPYL